MKTIKFYCLLFVFIHFTTVHYALNTNLLSQCQCTSDEQCLSLCQKRPEDYTIVKAFDENNCSNWDLKRYRSADKVLQIQCLPCNFSSEQIRWQFKPSNNNVNLTELLQSEDKGSGIIQIEAKHQNRDISFYPSCKYGKREVRVQIVFCGVPQRPNVTCKASPRFIDERPSLRVICEWSTKRVERDPNCSRSYAANYVLVNQCKQGTLNTTVPFCKTTDDIETCHVVTDPIDNVDFQHRSICLKSEGGYNHKFPNLELTIIESTSAPTGAINSQSFQYPIDLNTIYIQNIWPLVSCNTTYCNIVPMIPNFAEFCQTETKLQINALVYINHAETNTITLYKNQTFFEIVESSNFPCHSNKNVTVSLTDLYAGYKFELVVHYKVHNSRLINGPYNLSIETLPTEPKVEIIWPPGAYYITEEGVFVMFLKTVPREQFSAPNFEYLLDSIANDERVTNSFASSTPKIDFNISDLPAGTNKFRIRCRNSIGFCNRSSNLSIDPALKALENIYVTISSEAKTVEVSYFTPDNNAISYTIFWCNAAEWFHCDKNIQYTATIETKIIINLTNASNYVFAVSACYQKGCGPMKRFIRISPTNDYVKNSPNSDIPKFIFIILLLFIITLFSIFITHRRITKYVKKTMECFDTLADEPSRHIKITTDRRSLYIYAKKWFCNMFGKNWEKCIEELKANGWTILLTNRSIFIYRNNDMVIDDSERRLSDDSSYIGVINELPPIVNAYCTDSSSPSISTSKFDYNANCKADNGEYTGRKNAPGRTD